QTTFAPNNISYADGTSVNEQYGIGGSLQRREINIPGNPPEIEHYRFTTNGNLQAYMYENLLYVHYGYNDANTRTYKYSFDLNPNWVNGRLESVNFSMHNAMFYPNSYLNFNNDGYYTKHYYNGMERIASKLGDQALSISTHDPDLQDRKDQLDSNIRRNIVDITGYEFLPVGEEQDPDDPKPIYELPQVSITNLVPNTSSIYYYHPNHLGSTAFITDQNQTIVQGFLYAPFGEITNEYNAGWQSGTLPKYSFNAKELDEETGMYYYEARYYQPPTFTSRDPLFEKYPTFTPYAYCANNPVKYVDPSGMIIDSAFVTKYVKRLLNPTDEKYNSAFADLYKKLDDDPLTTYRFIETKKRDGGGLTIYGGKDGSRDVINIYYSKGSVRRAEEACILEETFHANQFMNGEFGYRLTNSGEFHSMLAFDRVDEVDAKIFAAKNVNFKTNFELGLLRAASDFNRVEAVWRYLEGNPSVDFDSYRGLFPQKQSMSDLDVLYRPNGTAYTNTIYIVGRKPSNK
ncbi:MAG: RHS repeat-associated core domain-containing protein, partial [Bacteroidales bacterium]|nr:RHS repeat-associated core domain-containing protein [Bacteroidales bacterium]